ncbi:hypothetical protein ACIBCM_25100 [Streptomyces sp. NPDC051018]|uniref:hypothetical protein n=1 Tax=Streptomyces sp. NPDC051018 TaxID=3365639 RepID=UPI0037A6A0C7
MRLRRVLALSAAALATVAMSASVSSAAPPDRGSADFVIGWLSLKSPIGGYGAAEAYSLSDTTGYLQACDRGPSDSYGAVAILQWGTYSQQVEDPNGAGTACAAQPVLLPPVGSNVDVTILACLRYPGGNLEYCDSTYTVR